MAKREAVAERLRASVAALVRNADQHVTQKKTGTVADCEACRDLLAIIDREIAELGDCGAPSSEKGTP